MNSCQKMGEVTPKMFQYAMVIPNGAWSSNINACLILETFIPRLAMVSREVAKPIPENRKSHAKVMFRSATLNQNGAQHPSINVDSFPHL